MTPGYKTYVCGAAFLLVVLTAGLVAAQDARDRTMEQYLCKDVVRESGADRDVAIAFLHGFLLGRTGGSKFNLDALQKQSSDFIERCLDNPVERAVDAMSSVRN